MFSIHQFYVVAFVSLAAANTIDSGFDDASYALNNNLRHQEKVNYDEWWEESVDGLSYNNETTLAPSPSVAPSSNFTTVAPSPSPSVPPTSSPTTLSPTPAPPITTPPTHAPSHHPRSEWWKFIGKLILKTVFWMIVAGLFFFAFGAVMSNRYRIYYYLRGSWYSLLQKLKWSRRNGRNGSAQSPVLNDIIFLDNDMQEGLLMRET